MLPCSWHSDGLPAVIKFKMMGAQVRTTAKMTCASRKRRLSLGLPFPTTESYFQATFNQVEPGLVAAEYTSCKACFVPGCGMGTGLVAIGAAMSRGGVGGPLHEQSCHR